MKKWFFGLCVVSLVGVVLHGCGSADFKSARPTASVEADGADSRHTAPPGSLPSADEELWVIVRPKAARGGAPDPPRPGSGALVVPGVGDQAPRPIPLERTEVKARLDGFVASVDVTQRFVNPFQEKIEAAYVFPLPQNAAINGFVMTVGQRKIRGIVRDRAEAEQIYASARRHGRVASLLTQERPNIFTQKVANIEPGKKIDVSIRYFHTLRYEDGEYEFVFPMVVGPRFNPPGFTRGVDAVAADAQVPPNPPTAIRYSRPGQRRGHDIQLSVEIHAGGPIESVRSLQHKIAIDKLAPEHQSIQLAQAKTIPNKDFILRYRVAGQRTRAHLMTHHDPDTGEGTFALMLLPPQDLNTLERAALEMVFVLDCSGSMSGRPMQQAKAAIDRALKRLKPSDTFQVIRFSDRASILGPKPIIASPANLRRARAMVATLRGQGGTHMLEGIKASLDFPHDPDRLRFVTFLTDGYIGNEQQVLSAIHQRLGASRIFSFGVGSSPNRFLMHRMAKLGRGAAAYLPASADGDAVMDRFMQRISHPALANVQVDWGAMQVSQLQPPRLPDLFSGRPVILTGRFRGRGKTQLTLRGRAGDRWVSLSVPVDLDQRHDRHDALPVVWARRQIAEMMDQNAREPGSITPDQIKQLALRHGLVSAHTAFVAVDARTKTEGPAGKRVNVPVPAPEGIPLEATVRE